MSRSVESVESEIRFFCERCANSLQGLTDPHAAIDAVRRELPGLLLRRDLLADLLHHVVQGSGYPDLKRPTLFENEILLYVDPRLMFSLRLYLWSPGEHTFPHDHNSWGVIGSASDGYQVINYRRVDDGEREGYARLAESETLMLKPGETAFTLPFDEGIHRTGNASGESLVTLHLYGKSLPRGYLNGYDPAANRVFRVYPPYTRKRQLAERALESLQKGP